MKEIDNTTIIASDKQTIEAKIDETLKWLEANILESKDAFDKKLMELESVAKLYQHKNITVSSFLSGITYNTGPNVEEVD